MFGFDVRRADAEGIGCVAEKASDRDSQMLVARSAPEGKLLRQRIGGTPHLLSAK